MRYNEDPLLLSIGSLGIHWYGPLYFAGFWTAWYLGRRRTRQLGSTWTLAQLNQMLFCSVAAIIVGGRLGFVVLEGMTDCRADWLYPFKIADGGMLFNGSLCALIMAYESLALKQQKHLGDIFDFAAPLVGPGIFLARICNFILHDLQTGIAGAQWSIGKLPQQTADFSQALLEGLVLGTACWVFSSKPRPRLAPAGLFLVGYGLIDFFLRFLASDGTEGRVFFGWMTQDQMLSLPVTLLGVMFLSTAYRSQTPTGNVKGTVISPN